MVGNWWVLGHNVLCLLQSDKSFPQLLVTETEDSYHQRTLSPNDTCDDLLEGSPTVDTDPCMEKMLEEFTPLFTMKPGCTTFTQNNIGTVESLPARWKLRQSMQRNRISWMTPPRTCSSSVHWQRSTSQWTSALVFVMKKSSGCRLPTDHRLLNAYTKIPAYPIPHTSLLLSQFRNMHLFSSFDLSQEFLKIPVCKKDISKTVAVCL